MALAAMMALAAATLSVPAAHAADVVTVIDDAATGIGDGQFNYVSGWTASTGNPESNWVAGTEHWTNATGTFNLKFTGTGVRLFGVKAPNHGELAVSIDGGAEVIVDAYAATRRYKQVLFETSGLGNTPHTLTVRATGTKSNLSTGVGTSFDYAEITAPEPDETVGGIVDDAVTNGVHKFSYSAGWTAGTGNSTVNYHAGTEHWAKSAGNPSFTFSFTGVLATLHGVKDPAHGLYEVSVDGGAPTLVDGHSASRQFKQQIFSTGLLDYGAHTITLKLTGNKNPAATRADGEIDFATVYTSNVAATSVTMDTSDLRLLLDGEKALTAEVAPIEAIDRRIVWSSSDTAVATVSAAGLLKAVAAGTAVIKASTADGLVSATRKVEVTSLGAGLHGAVGETNFHYVEKKTFDDYERKYFEDVIELSDTQWQGTGWRGDKVNGQFVLWTGSEAQSGITVTGSELKGPNGAVIPAENVTLDRLRKVLAAQGNPSAGRPQESVPDILFGDDAFGMARMNVQGIWMGVDVPANATPGTYTGTVKVTTAEGQSIDFTTSLEVLDLLLPPANEWEHFVDLWQNPYSIARVENIPAGELFTRTHFDAMLPYYKKLAAGGQDVITATVVADPWNGQTYDKYGSMVKWTKKTDGTWAFDFTHFDAWVKFMMEEVGIDGQIDAYSMVNWASKILYFDEATGKDINAQVNVGTPEWNSMWGAFLDQFGPHLKSKGWFEKTFMAMDERALGDLIKAVDLIDIHAPGLKIGAAMNYNSLDDPRLDRIDKISVGSHYVDLADEEFKAVAEHRKANGLITSIYNCVGHYPNSFTRSNPAEGNWVQWKNMELESDGYLRWAFDNFVQDPFTTTDFRTWESGDTAQLYPGALSSVRWEKMTEGIRDAEKIRILQKASPVAAAELAALMAGMKDPGYATDPFGGMIDPGVVNIPREVDRLHAGLERITRAHLATLAVPVTGVTLDQDTVSMAMGESTTLKATVLPATADNAAVAWASSDPSVLRVAANGTTATVTAVKAGSAVITVTTVDGGHVAEAAVTVATAPTTEPTPTPSVEPSGTASPTPTPTDKPSGSATTTPTPTDKPSPSDSPSPSATESGKATPGASATAVTTVAASATPAGNGQSGNGQGGDGLASTGASKVLIGAGIAAALLLLLGGAMLTLRRRSH